MFRILTLPERGANPVAVAGDDAALAAALAAVERDDDEQHDFLREE